MFDAVRCHPKHATREGTIVAARRGQIEAVTQTSADIRQAGPCRSHPGAQFAVWVGPETPPAT